MSFTTHDYEQLQKLMDEKPENRVLIQKLLDAHRLTVSKISHEVRNPLALIYSTLQLIESQHPEAKDFRHWTQMREDMEFTISLLQELSAYNNSEKLHPETFSAFDFFSRICLSFAASCTDSEVEFSSRLSPSLTAITGDRIKLQEVFLNLLKNARDAVSDTPSSEERSSSSHGSVRLEAFIQDHMLHVRISDNGCGIPNDQLDDIFEPFVTHKSGGTGLGLAIARSTVEAHHGSIQVLSKLHEGTCFTILLPVS